MLIVTQMSEEIENTAVVVPQAIVLTYALNGIFAFAMVISVLFCTQDIDGALSSPTQYSFMEIFLRATGSATGATIMAGVVTVMDICATISSLASTSRQLWSFLRDHGVPGWKRISKVWLSSHILAPRSYNSVD